MILSFKKVLSGVISIVVLAITLIVFISIQLSRQEGETIKIVSHTEQVISGIQKLVLSVLNNETGSRGYVITGKDRFLEPLWKSSNEIADQIKVLKKLIGDEPGQKALFDSLVPFIQTRIAFSGQMVSLRKNSGSEAASALVLTGQGIYLTDKIREIADNIEASENLLLDKRRSNIEKTISHLNTILYFALGAGFILVILILQRIRSDTREKDLHVQKFSAVLEAATDAMMISNERGKILLINQHMEKLFGYSRSELIGKPVEVLIPIDLYDKHLAWHNQIYSGPKPGIIDKGLELFAKKKDGASIPMEISLSILTTADGTLIFSSLRDITERKNAEAKLGKARKNFQLLVSSVKDYAIFLLDKEGNVASWNSGAEHMKGYTAEEIIGKPIDVFYTEEERQRGEPKRNLEQTIVLGHFETEGIRLRKNGSLFFADVVFTALYDESGDFYGYAKVTKDISEKRKTEESLHFLAGVADSIQDPVISTDQLFRINRWNEASEKLFEWGKAEVIGKTILEILKPQYPFEIWEQIFESLKGKKFWQGEIIYHTKSGRPLNILAMISNLKSADGIINGNLILARDITERKKAEVELGSLNVKLEQKVKEQTKEVFRNEKRFRAMIENSSDFITLTDEASKIIYHSPSTFQNSGWGNGEDLNGGADGHIHPEDREKANQVIREAIATPGKPINAVMRTMQKNGNYIWLEGVVTNLLNDENVRGFVSNYHDVTRWVEEHKKLVASEVRYRRLFEAAKDGILILNAKTGVIEDVNPFLVLMLGFSHEELLGKQLWEIGLFKDIVENKEAFQKLKKEGYTRYDNLPLKTKSNQSFWVEFVSNVYEVGEAQVIQCNIRDISERKKAEQAIRESNERFELVISATNDVIWDWDIETNKIKWNTNYYWHFGYNENTTAPDLSSWQDKIHPSDKIRVISGIRKSIANKQSSWQDEYRFVKSNGNYAFILDFGHILYHQDGKAYRMVGAMLDISDRKIAEEEIKKSNERFQLATQATADTIWELNLRTKEYLVHQGKGKLFRGNKVLSWQNWIDAEYIDLRDRDRVKNSFNTAIENKACELWEEEYMVNFSEDSIMNVINHAIFIRDEQGNAIRVIGAFTDISEKKKLETKLFEQQKREHLNIIKIVMEAQEKERNAIGQELHDNVNQILAGTNLFLSLIKKHPEKSQEYIDTSMNNIRSAIEENRKIAHVLVTPDVEEILLKDLIINLTDSLLGESGIKVTVSLQEFEEKFVREDQKLAIYRIVQEQCTNIIKHASAKLVNILLSTADGFFKMFIVDDGRGMEPGSKTDGIGIRNIKGRLILFNGNASIDTSPGKGFTLEITMPLGIENKILDIGSEEKYSGQYPLLPLP
jgi:PAS domain S-box-containing protein